MTLFSTQSVTFFLCTVFTILAILFFVKINVTCVCKTSPAPIKSGCLKIIPSGTYIGSVFGLKSATIKAVVEPKSQDTAQLDLHVDARGGIGFLSITKTLKCENKDFLEAKLNSDNTITLSDGPTDCYTNVFSPYVQSLKLSWDKTTDTVTCNVKAKIGGLPVTFKNVKLNLTEQAINDNVNPKC